MNKMQKLGNVRRTRAGWGKIFRSGFRVLILSLLYGFLFDCTAEARSVYVRLTDAGSSITISSSGGMTLSDANKKTHALGKSAVFRQTGNTVLVGKEKFLLPVKISSSGGYLSYNNKKYRGDLHLSRDFKLINILDVEDYVRGVLPAEVGTSWPEECLKVQAIISRTYVLRQSLNRSAKGYDVVDTVSDQVYKGAGVESSRTNKAVDDTSGMVLTYGNSLAFAPFHSDSGGHTANNAHVWGKNLPYLSGVKEPVDYKSPNSNWVSKIPVAKVQAALGKVGGGAVGQLKEIRIAEADEGGRSKTLLFVGTNGTATVKSSLFRMAVGPNLMKSTMLSGEGNAYIEETPPSVSDIPEVQESDWMPDASETGDELPKVPVPVSDTPMSVKEEERLTRMTSDGVFNSAELMDMLMNPNKRKGYLYIGIQRNGSKKAASDVPQMQMPKPMPGALTATSGQVTIVEDNGYFIFKGKGWGHGVGLSQWGAQALAKQGWTAERILDYYYQGTNIKRFK